VAAKTRQCQVIDDEGIPYGCRRVLRFISVWLSPERGLQEIDVLI
jgi:hypothetical protein